MSKDIYIGKGRTDNKQHYMHFSKELKEKLDKFFEENCELDKSYLTNRIIEEGLKVFETEGEE